MDGSSKIGISQEQRRHELARDLTNAACLRGDFVMSSGLRSSLYFDKYLFETKPGILRRLASLLAELVPATTDRLAGAELGGVALVTAVSLETGLPFVIIRKYAQGDNPLEGELVPGDRVTLIEDVLTTGNAAISAARQLQAADGAVQMVLGVLDLERGAASNLAAAGFASHMLFDRSELGLEGLRQ
jgi:orotate phosphoribosyltransferase